MPPRVDLRRQRNLQQAVDLGARAAPQPEQALGIARPVRGRTEKDFDDLIEWIATFVAAQPGSTESKQEAEQRLILGDGTLAELRRAFHAYGVTSARGRLSKVLAGVSSGIGDVMQQLHRQAGRPAPEPEDLVDHANFRLGLLSAREQQVLRGFKPPGPDDHPLTPTTLLGHVNQFFTGVNRRFSALQTDLGRLGDQSRRFPYSLSFRAQMFNFVKLLEKAGYLTRAHAKKHTLSPEEIRQTHAAVLHIPVPPVDRLMMGFVLTLLEVTGLRPGEIFRDSDIIEDDDPRQQPANPALQDSDDATPHQDEAMPDQDEAQSVQDDTPSEHTESQSLGFGNASDDSMGLSDASFRPRDASSSLSDGSAASLYDESSSVLDSDDQEAELLARAAGAPGVKSVRVIGTSKFRWKSVKIVHLKDGKFGMTISWVLGKSRAVGDNIPTIAKSQPDAYAAHCPVRWILAIGLLLNVFTDETDSRLRSTLFETPGRRLARDEKLKFKAEWREVPVIVHDASRRASEDLAERRNEKILVPMTWRQGDHHLKLIADYLGWASLTFYDFRRAFAVSMLGRIDEAHLRQLMGHRRDSSSTLQRYYMGEFAPYDQAGLPRVVRQPGVPLPTSSFARAASGRTAAAPGRPQPTESLEAQSRNLSGCSERIARLRDQAKQRPSLSRLQECPAAEFQQDDAFELLEPQDRELVEELIEAEIDFVMVCHPASLPVQVPATSASGPSTMNTSSGVAAFDASMPELVEDSDDEDAEPAEARRLMSEVTNWGVSPLQGKSIAECLSLLGSTFALEEAEFQGFCPECLEERPRDAIEDKIVLASEKELIVMFGDAGLKVTTHEGRRVSDTLSKSVLKTALLDRHRYRREPLVGMDEAQLKKLCRIHRLAFREDASKEELLVKLYGHWGRRVAANGMLNDGSSWLDRDPTVAPDISLITKPRLLRACNWELRRLALRVGVPKEENHIGSRKDAGPAKLIDKILERVSRPRFRPHLPPLASSAAPSAINWDKGEILGICPIDLHVHSLDPESQGFEGIGRLGLIMTAPKEHRGVQQKFRKRVEQRLHIVQHTLDKTPGLRHCWFCLSWYEIAAEPDHDERCREEFFSEVDPITAEHLEITLPKPKAGARMTSTVFVSPDAPTEVWSFSKNFFEAEMRRMVGLRVGFRRSAKYNCVFDKCDATRLPFQQFLAHLINTHKFFLLKKGSDIVEEYDGVEKVYTWQGRADRKLRFRYCNPPISE